MARVYAGVNAVLGQAWYDYGMHNVKLRPCWTEMLLMHRQLYH